MKYQLRAHIAATPSIVLHTLRLSVYPAPAIYPKSENHRKFKFNTEHEYAGLSESNDYYPVQILKESAITKYLSICG